MLILMTLVLSEPAIALENGIQDVLQLKKYGLGLGLEIDGASHAGGRPVPGLMSEPSYRPTLSFTRLAHHGDGSNWLVLVPFELSGTQAVGHLSTGNLQLSQRSLWGAASLELRALLGAAVAAHVRLRVGLGAERFQVTDKLAGLSDVDWKAHGEVAMLMGVRFFSLLVVELGLAEELRLHDFTFRDVAWHEPMSTCRFVGRFGLEYRFNSLTN